MSKTTYALIQEKFGLHSSYLYHRVNANASGIFNKYIDRDNDGNVKGISAYYSTNHYLIFLVLS